MKVIINKTYPNFAEQKMYIQWDVESPPSTQILFSVYRSEAPNTGFREIASNIADSCFYVDTFEGTPGFFSIERPIYYKIKAVAGNETAESNPVYYDGTISADPKEQPDIDASYRTMNRFQYDKQRKLVRNSLMQNFKVLLEKMVGIEAILLKRKHWGNRCGYCFDPVANKQVKSHCTHCYDTTWIGGYWPMGILVYERSSMPIQVGKETAGTVEVRQNSYSTLYFPQINYGDIMIIKYNNTRYFIKTSPNVTNRRTIPVHQTFIVDLIPPEHVIYQFPIDTMNGVFYVK